MQDQVTGPKTVKRRGRPPRAEKVEAQLEAHEHKKALVKKEVEKAVAVDEWYQFDGVKLIKKTKLSNGNVHSVYVGQQKQKGFAEYFKRLKKQGLVRM